MIGKKINQLATELAPQSTDLTIIGDPISGVSKKITLAQLGAIFSGAVSFYTNLAAFPVTGDINVIYCAKDTQKLYLWSGSAYVEVFPSQALLDTYQLRSEKGNANGYASLDSLGKVPISQLPSSIMEYKGTWNAATNTPTLANGTGDTGDVYICNVAGTVNFGAGPLTFAVGDYVIYSGTIWQRSSGAVGTVTSVAASITGNSVSISGSPIVTAGTLAFAFAGNATQYVRGDGQLATLPTNGGGGGASVSYYLNGSINQGTLGGVTYYEMNKTPIIGAGTDFTRSSNGYIASFLTDANDPALLNIPAGNFNFETYFQASSGGGSPTFYIELYKYNGTTFTLIASNSTSPKLINDGTNIEAYFSALAVPQTTLTLTDRLAIRIYVTTAGRTITLHTENGHLCQVVTTFTTGLTALNGLTAQVQYLATGTSGSDFNIASASATHTFNLPTASATNRGALSSADWSVFNAKEPAITLGTTAQYFRGDKTFQTLNTTAVPEGTNLYFTNARTIASTLTGYTSGAGTITSSDSILSAIQKLNGNIGALTTGVSSVNGLTGAVTLTTSNIAEGTNLYYTEARVNANTNVAANTAARHNAVTIGTANGLSLSTQVLSLGLASTSTTGALSSTDWNTFNNKTSNTGTVTSVGLSSATSGVTIGSTPITTSGTITLAIATASGSQQGLLSSSDWNTFNNKQNALTNPVTGTGNNNFIPKFTTTGSTIGNSILQEGTNAIGLGVTPSAWSQFTALQLGGNTYSAIASSNNYIIVSANTVYDGSDFKYITTGAASRYQQSGGGHEWHTAPSGTAGNAISFTQAMTLDASGRLGIGTTSPKANLHVRNSATSLSSSTVTYSNTTTQGLILDQQTNTNNNGSVIWFNNDDLFSAIASGRPSNGNWGTDLRFYTHPDVTTNQLDVTERMRITSGGEVLVNSTSTGLGFVNASKFGSYQPYNGDSNSTGISSQRTAGMFAVSGGDNSNNQGSYSSIVANVQYGASNNPGAIFRGYGNTTLAVQINYNGNITNTNNSYGAISDISLKENISDTTSKLADLLKVKVRNYNLIGDDKKQIGVIAQELETIFPSMIEINSEGLKSVKYSVFVPMLIKAIQELNDKIK